MRASKKPRLFVPGTRRPPEDPVFITEDIEHELRLSAPSNDIFLELKKIYSKIRSRNIESTKVFRVSCYRLRLPPNGKDRTSAIRSHISRVVDRQVIM